MNIKRFVILVSIISTTLLAGCNQQKAIVAADAIYAGGTIITMNEAQASAEALAVKDGKIIAVGSKENLYSDHQGSETQLIDLAGNTLMPSFIDAHGHFMNALNTIRWANVSAPPVGEVSNIAELVLALDEYRKQQEIKKGDWIIGYGYDESLMTDGRHLTSDDLDEVLSEYRVLVIHSSNHGAVLNAQALTHYKIDATTETPAGGVIARKPDSNQPAGLLMESAFSPIFADLPQPTEEENLVLLKQAQEMYAAKGFTTVQEGATHAKELAFLKKAASRELFFLDVVSLPVFIELEKTFPGQVKINADLSIDVATELKEQFGQYNSRLKLGGIKLLTDGSNQGKTGYWTKPILTPGPLGQKDWRGEPLMPQKLVSSFFKAFHTAGVQVFTHCNADAATDMLIEAATSSGVVPADDRRHVVIHSQVMRPDQLDSYAQLGLTPSFFTVHAFYWGDVHITNMGMQRASFISPMASAKAKGLRFSNHNDFMVTPQDAMMMAWTAMSRTTRTNVVLGPAERVDAYTAFKAITLDAAWQYHEEASKGSLEPGKLADLVILDKNPLDASIDQIRGIKVLQTIKEGKTVYQL